MQTYSLNKRLFFELIKKRGFLYGENFLKKSIPELENLLENHLKKKIKISQNEQPMKKLLNEITKIKKKWVKLQGGHQREKFLETLENQNLNIEFFEECKEISSGNNILSYGT